MSKPWSEHAERARLCLKEAVLAALERKRRLGHYAIVGDADRRMIRIEPDEQGVWREYPVDSPVGDPGRQPGPVWTPDKYSP